MLQLENQLTEAVSSACNSLYGSRPSDTQISIQSTRTEFQGDRTVVVFPFARLAGKSPEETGKEIGAYLVKQEKIIIDFQVVKGFLNLSISDEYWAHALNQAILQKNFGRKTPGSKSQIMVEYSLSLIHI